MRLLSVQKTRGGKSLDFEKLQPLIEKLSEKYGLSLCYVFGSYASGTSSTLSDLDVAVLPERELELDELLDLTGELQEIFEEEALDLVDLGKAPLTLIHRVLRDGKCLFSRDLKTRIENETRWETLYLDTAPLRREHFESLRKRIEDGTFGDR